MFVVFETPFFQRILPGKLCVLMTKMLPKSNTFCLSFSTTLLAIIAYLTTSYWKGIAPFDEHLIPCIWILLIYKNQVHQNSKKLLTLIFWAVKPACRPESSLSHMDMILPCTPGNSKGLYLKKCLNNSSSIAVCVYLRVR